MEIYLQNFKRMCSKFHPNLRHTRHSEAPKLVGNYPAPLTRPGYRFIYIRTPGIGNLFLQITVILFTNRATNSFPQFGTAGSSAIFSDGPESHVK